MRIVGISLFLLLLTSCAKGTDKLIQDIEPVNQAKKIRVKFKHWPLSFVQPSQRLYPLDVSANFHILAFGNRAQKGPKAYILARAPYFNDQGKPQMPVPSAKESLAELVKSLPEGGELISSRLMEVSGFKAARVQMKSKMSGKDLWMVMVMIPIDKQVSYQISMMAEKERYAESLKVFDVLLQSIKVDMSQHAVALESEINRARSR